MPMHLSAQPLRTRLPFATGSCHRCYLRVRRSQAWPLWLIMSSALVHHTIFEITLLTEGLDANSLIYLWCLSRLIICNLHCTIGSMLKIRNARALRLLSCTKLPETVGATDETRSSTKVDIPFEHCKAAYLQGFLLFDTSGSKLGLPDSLPSARTGA